MSIERYEPDLKQALYESYPCIPFTAKKNAKAYFAQLKIFGKGSASVEWVDKQPSAVISAFILFFTKKRLEGIDFEGVSGMLETSESPKGSVKAFIVSYNEKAADSPVEELRGVIEASNKSLKEVDSTTPIPEELALSNGTGPKRGRFQSRKRSVLIVLIGLPGSGKTTFCECLRQSLTEDELQIVRLSQDETSKGQCESDAHLHLSGTQTNDIRQLILVDRTNINVSQRATWLKIAQRYSCPSIALHFQVEAHECVQRASSRTSHPTLDKRKAPQVINTLNKMFVAPSEQEGFRRVLTTDTKDVGRVIQELKTLLNEI